MSNRATAVTVALACVLLAASPAVTPTAAESAPGADDPNPCVGTVTSPAGGTTVISVQGMRFGENGGKRPARLIGVGPTGEVEWVFRPDNVVWGYDVDPLDDGTLFVTATTRVEGDGKTVFYKFDPETGEVIWSEVVDLLDTHDADLLDDHRILIANMRATENVSGNRDRLTVYNRTSDEYVWEWRFSDHYPRDVGGNYSEDWTHVNDVDRVAEGEYLASPRNFDQVILVNRSTGEIDLRLGSDDDHSVLNEQHNPDYLESENGTPTFLVGDSDNDRIVEYANRGDGWTRTWELGGSDSFDWPRDADRLPNGNTLIADSRNDRVVEVTPTGEVVWEFYAPWLVYDVERVPAGDGSNGPTVADQGAAGSYEVTGAADVSTADVEACDDFLANYENDWSEGTGTGDGSADESTDPDGTGRDEANLDETDDGPGGVLSSPGAPLLIAGIGFLAATVLVVAAVAVRRS